MKRRKLQVFLRERETELSRDPEVPRTAHSKLFSRMKTETKVDRKEVDVHKSRFSVARFDLRMYTFNSHLLVSGLSCNVNRLNNGSSEHKQPDMSVASIKQLKCGNNEDLVS